MTDLKIALWASNLAHPVSGPEGWLELVDRQMADAASQGARLLIMPEYISAHWLSWSNQSLSGQRMMDWMAAQGVELLPGLETLAQKHRIGLLAGTMPFAVENGTVNRAWILLPDGNGLRRHKHDKLVGTPIERIEAGWPIVPGGSVEVYEWEGLRFCVLICLDVEMPAVAARLQSSEIDLIIVPSMTSYLSGFHRVFDCAKARAIELFAATAAVGCIGELSHTGGNCSGAAVYLPCELPLGSTGRHQFIGPFTQVDGPGPMLIADIPIGEIRKLRHSGPEAWPGPFTIDHVEFIG